MRYNTRSLAMTSQAKIQERKVAAVPGSSKGQQQQQQKGKFIPISHIHRDTGADEDEEIPPDLTSVTSKGSDRRQSMQLNLAKSCNANFSTDDWLVVLVIACVATMAVFTVMCLCLHGEGKRRVTNSRPYNMGLLMAGCISLTVQLLMLCMYGFQWWTGV